jgi:hypothetical protein
MSETEVSIRCFLNLFLEVMGGTWVDAAARGDGVLLLNRTG